ncbi:hypothetical protein EJ04DRAFT_546686 [Polyplosphaeria fusca]|uniref:SnoaL-like domain-containing protein n=1 Tax=Polyplosphaeria fusca TaxID=682080 RepID=A0A9P4QN47_9PLEO|nr:hypothetical protein EJ04DRAFT_546686 [Polyplosphaeria fusca]
MLVRACFVVLALGLGVTDATTELNELARDIERVESVRAVKNLQRTFSQLGGFGKWADMAALFSNNATLRWGNETANGPAAIESWLRKDAGKMDGIHPGSLDTVVAENPLVNLAVDGRSAKARWNGLRFMGDGLNGTRIQGGIYENEYALTPQGWKISLIHYYAMYAGPYVGGWRNVGDGIPIIPYHFTPDETGIPVPPAVGEAPTTNASVQELENRIARMNAEDEVRNLQHAYGYYVDRRMWNDVVDLFATDASISIGKTTTFSGLGGVREAMERMGPEGLTQGINNDHAQFGVLVDVDPSRKKAITRGVEIAMLGDANTRAASWEFNVFRNHFVKDNGLWKFKSLEITPLIVADYYKGWGDGGTAPANSYIPPFINITMPKSFARAGRTAANTTDFADLKRRLLRSAAYDGAENESHAYGYFLDDLDCARMGALFAKRGHKASPFAGFYITPQRVTDACFASWGTSHPTLRSSISFHWRPQPVVLVSDDGRSATLRARLLQPSTSATKAGSFNNAIYHDQMVLEDGKWRLWSVTIDEFYWQSSSWAGGWSAANPRNKSEPNPGPAAWSKKYPPDASIDAIGPREANFKDPAHVVPVSQSGQRTSAGVLLAGVCSVQGHAGLGVDGEWISGAANGACDWK